MFLTVLLIVEDYIGDLPWFETVLDGNNSGITGIMRE